MSLNYGLCTANDLYEKLKRDAALLEKEVTSDRFFNFVVTGYSLIDWVRNDPAVAPNAKAIDVIASLYANRYLKICGDLAIASKHFLLKSREPVTDKATSVSGWGEGRSGMGGFGIGEESVVIVLKDGTVYPCLDFVTEVLRTWKDFFEKQGL